MDAKIRIIETQDMIIAIAPEGNIPVVADCRDWDGTLVWWVNEPYASAPYSPESKMWTRENCRAHVEHLASAYVTHDERRVIGAALLRKIEQAIKAQDSAG